MAKSIKGKKGNAVLDGITILVIIVVMGLISVFGLKVYDELNDEILNDTSFTSQEGIDASNELYEKYPTLLDNLFLFAFVLLIIFTLISVFMLDTHPIFFIITVMMLVAFFLVAILLGNVFYDVMEDDEMSGYGNQFSYMSWVMSHIVELMVAVGFILVIALFIKFKAG